MPIQFICAALECQLGETGRPLRHSSKKWENRQGRLFNSR